MTSTQVEVITSVERRRRWSQADKERLVVASLEPGAMVSAIARGSGDPSDAIVSMATAVLRAATSQPGICRGANSIGESRGVWAVRVARCDRDRVWLGCPTADHRSR